MDFIFEYLNNWFIDDYDYYHKSINLTFTASDQIGGDLSSTDLVAGMFIKVGGSRLNDGAYLIKHITDSAITIDTDYSTILTEAEISCNIYYMDVPKSLRNIIATMLTEDAKAENENVQSEKQGDRSITYADERSVIKAFTSKLRPYRRMRW